MAVKEVLLIGNPVLREKSERVMEYDQNLIDLIQNLKDTIIDFQRRKGMGRGIAAPQIGVLKKVIYLYLPETSFAMINPEIIWNSEETFQIWDSCFSFDVAFFVKTERFKSIKVRFQDEKGDSFEKLFTNDLSELLQHEIDHLQGVLATDHLKNNQDIILRSEWEKRYM
mgnify:CR=1 FL=1